MAVLPMIPVVFGLCAVLFILLTVTKQYKLRFYFGLALLPFIFIQLILFGVMAACVGSSVMQPDPLAYGPDLSLGALFMALVLLLILFCGMGILFGTIGKKYGSAALMGTALLVGLIPMVLLGAWTASCYEAEAPQTVHQTVDDVEHIANNFSNTLGDLEKELDEFTKPQIDLGEKTEALATEEESIEESSRELSSEPKQSESLPDWVANPPKSEEGVWRRVVSTEPCFTDESLKHERAGLIVKALSDYLDEQLDSEIPQDVLHQEERRREFFVGAQKRNIYTRHTETRETSVGDASIFHLMVSIDSSDKKWFEKQLEISRTKKNHANRGLRASGVGWLSVVVLCGLAVLYELLRVSEK